MPPAPLPPDAPTRDVVVVGASAGGIHTLETLVAGLPEAFPAAVFVVCHTSPNSPGVLPQILTRAGALRARYAVDGEHIERGRIYVAPPDHHLLVEPGRVRITRGPKENRFRPAVDPLFRSAALTYGRRVVGVVLSGMLSDGTAGLWVVKDRGGCAVVQDPDEAAFPSMPASAMGAVDVDRCLPIAAIPAALVALTGEPLPPPPPPPSARSERLDRAEVRIAMEDVAMESGLMELSELSPFTCPECHGVLMRLKGEGPTRFRCHTGHAYSAEALLSELGDTIEASIWSTIRALEERAMLIDHLARHVREAGDPGTADRYAAETMSLRRRLALVRQAFLDEAAPPAEADAPGASGAA